MRIKILFLLVSLSVISCKEIYDEYEVGSSEEYLVVEGMITNDPGPYYVTINKAIPYRNDLEVYTYKSSPETGAQVKIKCNDGSEVVLHELESLPGTYATDSADLRGETGQSYSLFIQTQKGEIYESQPSKIFENPEIVSMDAKLGDKTILDETKEIPMYVTKKGLKLACNMVNKSSAKYIKIDARFFSESMIRIDSLFYQGIETQARSWTFFDYFCWNLQQVDPIPNIISAGNDNTQLNNIAVGFATKINQYSVVDTSPRKSIADMYIVDSLTGNVVDTISQASVVAVNRRFSINKYYVADLKAYCIDDTIYSYYRNLKNQATAYTKIFDPIPVQLTGNIKCISQPDKNIFGVFIAAGVAHQQFVIKWDSEKTPPPEFEKLNDYYPFQGSDKTQDVPLFWRY